MTTDLEALRRHEIPNRIAIVPGHGGLPKVLATSNVSTAEIYLQGAQVTGFRLHGEPPLLFLSARSRFAPGQAIRGGVPICFPWFGPRAGDVAHGFARMTEWELTQTATAPDGTVTVRFRLPERPARAAWKNLRTEFAVTVADKLTMELIATNAGNQPLEIENCLHTYLHVGDIGAVSLTGLAGAPFDDFAAGATGTRQVENDTALRITKETNRVYPDSTGAVEIRDEKLRRSLRVEKFHSRSTVVWNPWTTQKLPDDFDPAEHRQMLCVESGNVKQNQLTLAPGATAAVKVVLSRTAI